MWIRARAALPSFVRRLQRFPVSHLRARAEITDDERLQRYYHMDLDALTVEDVTGLLAVYKRLYANTQGRLARVMERSSRSSLSSP